MYRSLVFTALLAFAGGTLAADGVKVDVDGDFGKQRQAILKDLADGETYSEIDPRAREQVHAALSRISSTLQRAGGVGNLDDTQKVEVFNDQEQVNAVLTNAGEDSRLVCTRERKTGSRRYTNHCMTVAERRRARENADSALRNLQTPMLKHGEI